MNHHECEACGDRNASVSYSDRYKTYLCEACEETARRMEAERDGNQ